MLAPSIKAVSQGAPKSDAGDDEYEDAYQNRSPVFVIADGATEGYLSGMWARHLVAVVSKAGASPFAGLVQAAAEQWSPEVSKYLDTRAASGRPLRWYEELKLEMGAYATLAAVRLDARVPRSSHGPWHVSSVGDACVFQVRKNKLRTAWPILRSDEFGVTPDLVSSRAAASDICAVPIVEATGTWFIGDHFYLMTDAIAAWFLAEYEHGRKPWRELDGVLDDGNPDLFRAWIEMQRRGARLRDDDVTVTRLRVRP